MSSIKDAKNLFRMQREAKKVKKQLKKMQIEAEADGVKVIVSAEQEVLDVIISPEVPREAIPALLKDALNRAMKKAQVVAAEQMKDIMGDMGLGGAGDPGMRGLSQ